MAEETAVCGSCTNDTHMTIYAVDSSTLAFRPSLSPCWQAAAVGRFAPVMITIWILDTLFSSSSVYLS